MFVVHHYNFGTKKQFRSLVDAVIFTKAECFDAAIYHRKKLLLTFSAMSGCFQKPILDSMGNA